MERSNRPRIARLNWLDTEVRAGRYPNARTMSEALETSERTARRDIQHLRDRIGAPLEFDRKRNGYYYTDPHYVLPAIHLTQGELVAAFVAEKVLAQYVGTPYEQHLRSAFEKLVEALPQQVSVSLGHFDATVSFDLGPARPAVLGWYQVFCRAVEKRQRVWMRYYTASRDEETERQVDPYHLHNHQGDWYIIAYDHLRGAMRDFALSRVREARLSAERFTLRRDFDLEAYLGQSFGVERGAEPVTVRIRFDAYQARWVRERTWHETQQIEEHPDGGLTLSFTVTGLEEVKRWVLQYGAHAEVLEPANLRAAVVEEVAAMRQAYL